MFFENCDIFVYFTKVVGMARKDVAASLTLRHKMAII